MGLVLQRIILTDEHGKKHKRRFDPVVFYDLATVKLSNGEPGFDYCKAGTDCKVRLLGLGKVTREESPNWDWPSILPPRPPRGVRCLFCGME